MAAQQILVLFVQVRILVGQLRKPDFTSGFLFLRINPKFLLFYTKISPIKRAFRFMKSGKPQVLEKYRYYSNTSMSIRVPCVFTTGAELH